MVMKFLVAVALSSVILTAAPVLAQQGPRLRTAIERTAVRMLFGLQY
jgi:hypothetical protein